MGSTAPSNLAPARSPFRERLGTYLTGVAIGCVLAGAFLAARQLSAAADARAKAAAARSAPTATGGERGTR